MGLQEYRRKRNFAKTREPRGGRTARHQEPIFVVQKHDASHLHYDFRLELDGVLKSWAVPKGPDLDPSVKRLAMQVEDHPLEYAEFEGIIPPAEYGGGTVMLWDRGTWKPLEDPRKGLRAGHLKFTLNGEKLRGNWMLVRRGGRKSPEERTWFLFKERDKFAVGKRPITERLPLSVATGRDLDQIAKDADRVWGANGEIGQRQKRGATVRKKTAANRTKQFASAASDNIGPADTFLGVRLTHPDKVLYPEHGYTKRDLAEYYVEVADWILPHVVNRPMALVRCPGGRSKPCFFQKHPGKAPPKYLKQVNIASPSKPEYNLVIENTKGLIELVQMGVLEIHIWGSVARNLDKPNRLIFDLDPDPAVEWPEVIQAAREVRVVLEELGLVTFVKTTGGKGLHIVVPIQARIEWDDAKAFCKAVADLLVRVAPERYVATMSKAARKGKIFIDYMRNSRGATSIAPYSSRAREDAPVSVPIAWEELSTKLRSDSFTISNLFGRLSKLRKDPWADIGSTRQSVTKSMIESLRNASRRSGPGR
jgi:bifunctional non-homologous end joining protein LigD